MLTPTSMKTRHRYVYIIIHMKKYLFAAHVKVSSLVHVQIMSPRNMLNIYINKILKGIC